MDQYKQLAEERFDSNILQFKRDNVSWQEFYQGIRPFGQCGLYPQSALFHVAADGPNFIAFQFFSVFAGPGDAAFAHAKAL